MALDPGSARVKEIARLSQKDARYETGLFLLEGPQGLKELAQYPELAQEIFVTESALERYAAEISTLEKAGVSVEQVSTRVMEKIADTKTPQGIVLSFRCCLFPLKQADPSYCKPSRRQQ